MGCLKRNFIFANEVRKENFKRFDCDNREFVAPSTGLSMEGAIRL